MDNFAIIHEVNEIGGFVAQRFDQRRLSHGSPDIGQPAVWSDYTAITELTITSREVTYENYH